MKIRMISKEIVNNNVIITVENKSLFRTKIRQFEAAERITNNFWSWLELPNRTLVPDALSFQLDVWNRT